MIKNKRSLNKKNSQIKNKQLHLKKMYSKKIYKIMSDLKIKNSLFYNKMKA